MDSFSQKFMPRVPVGAYRLGVVPVKVEDTIPNLKALIWRSKDVVIHVWRHMPTVPTQGWESVSSKTAGLHSKKLSLKKCIFKEEVARNKITGWWWGREP